jgi:hypothetical protein
MALTPQTFNQVIGTFKYIAENHPVLKHGSWGFGDISQIDGKENIIYPLMWVAPAPSFISGDYLKLRFNVLVMDLVQHSRENENDVTSDTLQILQDVTNYFKNNECRYYEVDSDIPVENFYERFNDSVAGWRAELTLDILRPCPEIIPSPCSDANTVYYAGGDPNMPCSHFQCLTSNTIYVNSFSAITIYSGTTNIENVIYNIVSGVTNAQNIGGGTGRSYAGKDSLGRMKFRTLSGGTYCTITTEAQTITINADKQPDDFWEFGINGQVNQGVQRKNSNNYTSAPYSLVAGKNNGCIGTYGRNSILGGFYNAILESQFSNIMGGRVNLINYGSAAGSYHCSIVGGNINKCYGNYSIIGQGTNNKVGKNLAGISLTHSNCTILNGGANSADGSAATVINGQSNQSYNSFSLIGNGNHNSQNGKYGLICNGNYNSITVYTGSYNTHHSSIINGKRNSIYLAHSVVPDISTFAYSNIDNGSYNTIVDSANCTILNGFHNIIQQSKHGIIGSGIYNQVAGSYSTIFSGKHNSNLGINSSIFSSNYCTINSGLTNVTVIGLEGYTAASARTTYTRSLLIQDLSGATTRMVVADSQGLLSTQSIPITGGSSSTTYRASAITSSNFAGLPYTASVTFSSAFSSTNYSIQITGQDERAWTYSNITSAGFQINTNSDIPLTGTTRWLAIEYN